MLSCDGVISTEEASLSMLRNYVRGPKRIVLTIYPGNRMPNFQHEIDRERMGLKGGTDKGTSG